MQTIPAKTIVTNTKSPSNWFGIDYNLNIYRGCPHGCIYCDSRSECYQNPDFDTVKVKQDALRIIRDDLRRKVKKGVVGTGAMSDPYNPFEAELMLSRHALELIGAFGFGAAIATKSTLVTRDIDILQEIKQTMPVLVKMTVTTADNALCKLIEPNVATTSERFDALQTLADAGIFCGVLMMPILPYINDTEENIGAILKAAKEAGAKFVYPALGLTLRQGNREYFYSKLDQAFPGLRDTYVRKFGLRYSCPSPRAKQLWQFFCKECEKYELLHEMKAINTYYKMGYTIEQLRLF